MPTCQACYMNDDLKNTRKKEAATENGGRGYKGVYRKCSCRSMANVGNPQLTTWREPRSELLVDSIPEKQRLSRERGYLSELYIPRESRSKYLPGRLELKGPVPATMPSCSHVDTNAKGLSLRLQYLRATYLPQLLTADIYCDTYLSLDLFNAQTNKICVANKFLRSLCLNTRPIIIFDCV